MIIASISKSIHTMHAEYPQASNSDTNNDTNNNSSNNANNNDIKDTHTRPLQCELLSLSQSILNNNQFDSIERQQATALLSNIDDLVEHEQVTPDLNSYVTQQSNNNQIPSLHHPQYILKCFECTI